MIGKILLGLGLAVLAAFVYITIYYAVSPTLRDKFSLREKKRPEIPSPYGMLKPPTDNELRHTRKEHPPAIQCMWCERPAEYRRLHRFGCSFHKRRLGGHPRKMTQPEFGKKPGSDNEKGIAKDDG